jgi:hypothetical protein
MWRKQRRLVHPARSIRKTGIRVHRRQSRLARCDLLAEGHSLPRECLCGEPMGNLKGLVSIVSELRVERTNLVNQLKHVDAALSVLGKLDDGSSYTKPRRNLSLSARKKMSLAQKARWAKRTNLQEIVLKPKRTMSAAARRKIAAFQRARWAKIKAQQKKAA